MSPALTDFIALAAIPLGTLFLTLVLTGPVWWRAIASRGWQTAGGRILSSAVAVGQGFRRRTLIVPDVRYEYKVAGVRYEGRTVRFNYSAYRPAETAARYHAGQQVTVYYNPHSPKRAVLEPGIQPGDVHRAMYPFLFFLALSLIMWVSVWIAPATNRSP
jgi:Protein of unknown function (DUF3592)